MTGWIAFSVLALSLVVGALGAVHARRLVSAILWLGVLLFSTAVLFITLEAPLLGGIQILLYVGGVMTLMIFGVMLTGAESTASEQPRVRTTVRAALAALAIFATLAAAILKSPAPSGEPSAKVSISAIGESLVTTNLLAFEVLSILLLGAMVGSIVLARRSDASESEPGQRVRKLTLTEKES